MWLKLIDLQIRYLNRLTGHTCTSITERYNQQTHFLVPGLGLLGFILKKANGYNILVWGCMVRPKSVVGNPDIIVDTSYAVINMMPVKSLI